MKINLIVRWNRSIKNLSDCKPYAEVIQASQDQAAVSQALKPVAIALGSRPCINHAVLWELNVFSSLVNEMRAQYGTSLATLKTTSHKDGQFLIIILSKLK